MPSSDIPQDIIDLIIDELHSDKDALRQCSLAASPFLESSRRHLFAHIKVGSVRQCKRLHAVLAFNPTISPMIHKLHIVEMHRAHGYVSVAAMRVIQLLTEVGTLDTLHYERFERIADLDDVGCSPESPHSSVMKDLFMSVVPRLRSISMVGIPPCCFPLGILIVMPSLRHFAFDGRCRQTICLPHPWYKCLPSSPPPPASYLYSLAVSGDHPEYVIQYLRKSLSQLRTLRIPSSLSSDAIDLRLLSNLRLLALEVRTHLVNRTCVLLGRGLPRSIEHLIFVVPIEDILHADNEIAWAVDRNMDDVLATIFSSADVSHCIKGVYLVATVLVPPDGVVPPLTLDLERMGNLRFPLLHEMGLLRFVVSNITEVEAALGALENSL